MSDYQNENHIQQGEVDQQTRVVPPIEGSYSAAPRRRRADRYRTEGESNAEAPLQPERERMSRTGARGEETNPAFANRVQTRYAAQPPVSRDEMPSQGVPRPAVLSRGNQESRGEQANIRRPVSAPGYSQRQPLGNSSHRLIPEGDQLRARRPIPLDELDEAYEPEVQPPRKGRKWLMILLVIVIVLGLIVTAFLMLPNDDSTLGQMKANLSGQVSGLLGTGIDSTPDVAAMDFSAAPVQGIAPLDVAFTLTTSKTVTAARVVDGDGNPLATSTSVAMDNADSRIWMLNLTVNDGYEGTVQAQIQDGETWLDTGMTQQLEISAPQQPPVDVNAFASQEATAEPTETVNVTAEPTMAPTDAPTQEPTQEPAPTQTIVVTSTPTVAPTQTIVVTNTPTIAPTQAPAETPTLAPTDAPTQAPTVEVNPTVAPTVAPSAVPAMNVEAVSEADPKLIANETVYSGSKKLESYDRAIEDVLKMPAGDSYTTLPYGVMTYRGTAFRQNAAVGHVGDVSSMEIAWTADAGSAKGASSTYYGVGWTGQPAIVKWSKEVREATNMVEEKRGTAALKEVIVAGLDGKLYFLDLADGQPTRDAVKVGYPMKGTPSLHPLGYPIMTVGQYARKMASGTGEIGLRFYNLLTQKQVYMIDGLDGKMDRPYYDVGSFETSALVDPTTDTMVTAGTNGLLYLTKLNTEFDYNNGTIKIDPETVVLKSRTSKQKNKYTAVESSLAMYANYVYYADSEGILRCVDTSTLKTVWAVDTQDAVQAAISLDFDEDGNLWLYTANTLTVRSKGDCQIRRYNAATGQEDWTLSVNVVKKSKNGKTAGAMASAVIGQNDLSDLAYFALSNLSKDGTAEIFEGSDSAASGVLLAVNKKTGSIVWAQELDSYVYSSPVAVYSEDGKGWIIQASASGNLYLMDGLTGQVLNTLELEGTIEGSPAVYGSTLVIGTTGKNTSHIYGIKLQ